jgi:hypothetical protein
MGKSQREQEEYVVAMRSIRMNDDDATIGYCNSSRTSSNRAALHCTALHLHSSATLCSYNPTKPFFWSFIEATGSMASAAPARPGWLAGCLAGWHSGIF